MAKRRAPRTRRPSTAFDAGHIVEVRARHEARLLGCANVVGVADGVKSVRGQPTMTPCIVVLVSRKVPRKALAPADVIPPKLDDVPTDVVEVGTITALR
jgi:hypothetical protein